jgi:hypothetical protein
MNEENTFIHMKHVVYEMTEQDIYNAFNMLPQKHKNLHNKACRGYERRQRDLHQFHEAKVNLPSSFVDPTR